MTTEDVATSERPARTIDGLLLGAGTFTAVPVPPPRRIDAGAGAMAMLTAPVWGGLVGLIGAAAGMMVTVGAAWSGNASPLTALLAGVAAVAAGAWAARGLHLDGLADFADALASARRGSDALEVMRDPRLGALGAVTLGVALMLQAVALGSLFAAGSGAVATLAVAVLARAPLALLVRRGTPADNSGLGRTVVGSTRPGSATVAGALASAVALAALAGLGGMSAPAAGLAVIAAWSMAVWVRRVALRRFEVLTGDALGAAVELSATAALLILAVVG
ncbi:MAG: hypothetical protein RLZ55_66 [Actinomycetota bacterium]|jgi:adenosylcobinamide-GDP ribazoletransferase